MKALYCQARDFVLCSFLIIHFNCLPTYCLDNHHKNNSKLPDIYLYVLSSKKKKGYKGILLSIFSQVDVNKDA